MRRVHAQQFGRVGEIVDCRHGVDLNLRRRFHVHGRINFHADRFGRLAEPGQRRHGVTRLNLVHRRVVCHAVRLGAADDPDKRRRRRQMIHPGRHRAGPARWRHQKLPRLGPCGAPAWRSEHIAPHIEHRQQIEAAVRVRRGDDQRFLRQIEPGDGIQSVEIGAHNAFEIRRRILRHAHKHVHRTFAEFLAGFDIGELLAGDIHGQQWIEIHIGIHADGVSFLGCDVRLRVTGQRENCGNGDGQSNGCQCLGGQHVGNRPWLGVRPGSAALTEL
ncbi:hypothetical protein D3C84_649270 [compost metagenome]